MDELSGILYVPTVFSVIFLVLVSSFFIVFKNKFTKILLIASLIFLIIFGGLFSFFYITNIQSDRESINSAKKLKEYIENYCTEYKKIPDQVPEAIYNPLGYLDDYSCSEITNSCLITYYITQDYNKTFVKLLEGSRQGNGSNYNKWEYELLVKCIPPTYK